MSDEKSTRPTIETVLERINTLEERMNERFDAKLGALEERIDAKIDAKVDGLEGRLTVKIDHLDVRLDRLEAVVNATRGDMLDQRVEMRELRKQLKEHFPALP